MATYTSHTVDYDNKQIHYIRAGPSQGPLLIFVHGWPAIASTWKPQMDVFASLGFLVVAPDMPGYGASTSNKTYTDYSMESINAGLLAMLAHIGRPQAVWLGHDWGAGIISGLVAVHPEVCAGMVWMAVPYGLIENGRQYLLQFSDRNMYPVDECPNAQWDYMAYYEENFDKATEAFDKHAAAALKALYSRGSPMSLGKPAPTSRIRKDGGWFGGEAPPDVPLAYTCLTEGLWKELTEAMERTTFFGADAYYMNHERNREYVLKNRKNEGVLEMPVLFVQARYDTVCDTAGSRLLEPMKKLCKNFSFANVDAGHWLALEKPAETNAAVVKWLATEMSESWPGALQNGYVTRKVYGGKI